MLKEENMDGPKVLHSLNDGKHFIWQLERDGWNHLYLFDFEGMLHRRLTRGAFPVHEIVTVDETAGWVYFTARDDPKRPYDIHLCRVDLQGHNFARLTEAEGQHVVSFCPSKAFFLDTHSAVGRPPKVELRSSDGKRLKTLSKADVTTLQRLGWRPPEEVVVKAADGETDLWGVLYKPYNFDPSKKYPVINIVYGWIGMVYAPHSFKKLSHDFQGLANSGFIVWVLDGRGTAGRGRDFRRMVLGNVGRFEVSDLAVGLKQAASTRPFMNMDRVGVYGVSYGGYMALRAILTRPDVYKVGVAVCPITDMAGHMWNEFLLGPIEDNQAAYNYASNLPLAKNLKGKLLLIHGSSDRAVPFSHTMKMADALIQENKAFDLIVLPGQDHVGGYQYWWDALRRYFDEHLKP